MNGQGPANVKRPSGGALHGEVQALEAKLWMAGLSEPIHVSKTHAEPFLHSGWIERIIVDKTHKSSPKFSQMEKVHTALYKRVGGVK